MLTAQSSATSVEQNKNGLVNKRELLPEVSEPVMDGEKVTRNLKKSDTPILSGMQIFHNYVRPHMALDGRTPSEAAGIEVKGKDKWLTLIQNATQERQQ